jgi:hypothetical protein
MLHNGNPLATPRLVLNGPEERFRVCAPWFNRLLENMPPEKPLPTVSHEVARARALAAWEACRGQ